MIILQDDVDANDVLGTRLLGPPTITGLVKVNAHIRLLVSQNLDPILTGPVNYHGVLQNKLCNNFKEEILSHCI